MTKRLWVPTVMAALLILVAGGAFAQEEALNSVGALGAAYMYTSYLSIGAVADGHYYEVYDDDMAIQLMEELKGLADATTDSLKELLASDSISTEDFTFINEIISTVGLLQKEAESYQSYIQTGEERHAALYENYRNNAWSKISDLLGIEQ